MTEANVTKEISRPIGFWGFILRLMNWILIVSLLISYLAQWVSPEVFWPIAFFGIIYPALAVLNIAFFIHWIFRRRRFLVYPLVALLLGFPLINRFIQFGNQENEKKEIENPFKVLSYNVRVFDQYHHKYGKNNEARNQIVQFLKEQNADVYCLQEFYHRKGSEGQNNIRLLKKELNTPYCYFVKYTPKTKSLYNVIFSKKPIKSKGVIEPSKDGDEIIGIYADIATESLLIRIYSIHLQSFKISGETALLEMDFDLKTTEGQEAAKQNSLMLAKKFRTAFTARSSQIRRLKAHLAKTPLPIIVTGDFNDIPSSYTYSQLTQNMKDAFIANGKGFGQTYIGPYPSFRIDYILYNNRLNSYQFTTWPVKYSDHYPISSTFAL